jgi:NmrA-like family
MGKGFATVWKVGLKEKRLQLIAVSDIGYFAAQAFISPEEYKGQGISLAGDDLSFREASNVFKDKTGQEMPTTFEFLAHVMLWAIGHLGTMIKWFYTDGYGVDIQGLRKRNPGLLSFGDWLERKSKFEMKK